MSNPIKPYLIAGSTYKGDIEHRPGWSLPDVKALHNHLKDRHVRTLIAQQNCPTCMKLVAEGDARANGN